MSPRDARVQALIDLAKKMPTGESARRDAVSFTSFHAALERRRASRSGGWRRAPLRWATAALVASAAAATCWTLLPSGEPALRYAVERLPSAAELSSAPARRLRFSDGSQVTLEANSAAKVVQIDSHGARVVLERGKAEVAIARRKQAAWSLQAGPYDVRVTGTAFRISWVAESEQIEVDMRHGSVVVTGPMAGTGVALHAGQRLLGSPRQRRLLVEDWPRVPEAPPAVGAAADATPSASAASAARVSTRSLSAARGWDKRVARGDFATVLSEARAARLGRVLATAPAADLAALADAARYARQNALGRRALLALRERFPRAQEARDSAFFLGRASGAASALAWYERYLSEQPAGSYASQALGRSMMLHYERAETTLAAELAATYLQRFPGGPYAESARKLLVQARGDRTAP
jgi:FecR protein